MRTGETKASTWAHSLSALGVVWLVLYGHNFSWKGLLNVDWQAVGAIGSFAAAFVALWIASADQRRRNQERRSQAASLAIAMQRELRVLGSQARSIERLSLQSKKYGESRNSSEKLARREIATVARALSTMLGMLKSPLLEYFINRSSDFDPNTATQLTIALSRYYQLTGILLPTSILSIAGLASAADAIAWNCHKLRLEICKARRCLRIYKHVPQRINLLSAP